MTGKPRLTDGQFNDKLDELTVKAVGMYRQARAAKPDLSEREFMQAFRAAVSLGLGAGLAETAVAMMRYAAKLEDQIEAGGEGGRLRYIVLGTIANIEFWRRQNDLCRHDVIAVTSNVNLRGLGVGRYKLVTLASWKPTPEVAADVRESVRVIEAHGAVIER